MKKILNNIYIGSLNDYKELQNSNEWAFVHVTQTIHYKIMGWNRTNNKPSKNHPNYITYKKQNRFSVNWVDGPKHLYEWSGPEVFNNILDFIEKWKEKRKVLIHCDQGISRSPTIGLLYLAKRSDDVSNKSFKKAKKEFIKIYPKYNPKGIGDYVKEHWEEIN